MLAVLKMTLYLLHNDLKPDHLKEIMSFFDFEKRFVNQSPPITT